MIHFDDTEDDTKGAEGVRHAAAKLLATKMQHVITQVALLKELRGDSLAAIEISTVDGFQGGHQVSLYDRPLCPKKTLKVSSTARCKFKLAVLLPWPALSVDKRSPI